MHKRTSLHGRAARPAILALIIAAGLFSLPAAEQPDPRKTQGGPQLVAIRELPKYGQACEPSYVQVPEYTNSFGALGVGLVHAGPPQSGKSVVLDRDPIRQIRDLEP